MQERMNEADPLPVHCGPSCARWDGSEDRCGLLNEREQRINRHGNVGYFPDGESRQSYFQNQPCTPYETLLRRLLATPMVRRGSSHETRDAASQVLHAGIGRWLEGRAPLRVVQRNRETIWRHDAVLLSSRWPYYYLFRDELRREMEAQARARAAAGSSDEPDAPSGSSPDELPSPLPGADEAFASAQRDRRAAESVSALFAAVARIDPVGAAMLADPDYPEIDTAHHAAALAAEYARLGAGRKVLPADVTNRRHLAELRAAALGSGALERLEARHRNRSIREALWAEEEACGVTSRLLQGYLAAFDREEMFGTFKLQQAFAAAVAAEGADLEAVCALAREEAARAEPVAARLDGGGSEDQRLRAKKLRASAKKLVRYLERMAAILRAPIAGRRFADAVGVLRGHAFRPFDPHDRGPFTKLGLPASAREGDEHEPLLTAACLGLLAALLTLPRSIDGRSLRRPDRDLSPRHAVRLVNVLLRDFAVGFGSTAAGEESHDA